MHLTAPAPTSRRRSACSDVRDLQQAVAAARRLLDLDADPAAVDEHLEQDPDLGPLVRKTPGRRVPGAVAGHELAVKAVIGQQVSVAGARTVAGRLVPLARPHRCREPVGGLTHLFPTAERAGRRGSGGSPDAPVAWPGPDRAGRAPSPPARSSSTPGPTATGPVRNCWPDPASARGPPTTS